MGALMKQTDAQLRIRIPPDVKSWLEQEAARNLRSMSAEIVIILRDKMEASTQPSPQSKQ
jgi:hypothetical protein